MDDSRFMAYKSIKHSLPRERGNGCILLKDEDGWFSNFLKDLPTKKQFEEIFNDTIPDASIYYALWKVKA